jgi:hypothetical protein
MVRSRELAGAAVLALLAAGAASAQAQRPQVPQEQLEARFQIAAMEGVLEQAVQLGASNVNVQLQALAPDMVFLTGAPRARGFRRENYGLFFDVDVPVMRRSLQWTFRVLQRNDSGVTLALRDFRRKLQNISDPSLRQALEGDLQRIERQFPPARRVATSPEAAEPTGTAAEASPVSGPAQPVGAAAAQASEGHTLLEDPNQAYTEAVKNALIHAMLEYSSKVALAPTDWLTVAARDQEGARRAMDPYAVSTIILRVRGADLKAFHAGEIGLAEARARVDVREY